MTLLQSIKNQTLDFLYPRFCYHCQQPIDTPSITLCSTCAELIATIDRLERCSYCFTDKNLYPSGICATCHQKNPPYRLAKTLEFQGAVPSLVHAFTHGAWPLAKGFAAFLIAQLMSLGWPLPGKILATPALTPFSRCLQRLQWGYLPSHLLAKELTKLLSPSPSSPHQLIVATHVTPRLLEQAKQRTNTSSTVNILTLH